MIVKTSNGVNSFNINSIEYLENCVNNIFVIYVTSYGQINCTIIHLYLLKMSRNMDAAILPFNPTAGERMWWKGPLKIQTKGDLMIPAP